jgi:A/G-specific adenine glycosylase
VSAGTAQSEFAARLLHWHARHGRHNLPWQIDPTPYRVCLSEVMLQQTQVATVVPYFERFVAAFPDVGALARAPLDEVLHLWSGLGYYSRARNLHKTAGVIAAQHGGEFPADVDGLMALPGIGRSTAGAIIALAGNRRAAILDGNVKRVLARYHAIAGWPGTTAVLKRLWALAEAALPEDNFRDYSQAQMDLGATLCTRQKPACEQCPLVRDCRAYAAGRTQDYPGTRPRRALPLRSTCFLIIEDADGAVLLERRPPHGVWGGLWCFPEITSETDLRTGVPALGIERYKLVQRMDRITHTFTHFRLHIVPLHVAAEFAAGCVREDDDKCWYVPGDTQRLGLPTPVTRLLNSLHVRQP